METHLKRSIDNTIAVINNALESGSREEYRQALEHARWALQELKK